jgi:hypothetical protein
MKVQMTFSNEGLKLVLTGDETSLYIFTKTIDDISMNKKETITKDHRYIESEVTEQGFYSLIRKMF